MKSRSQHDNSYRCQGQQIRDWINSIYFKFCNVTFESVSVSDYCPLINTSPSNVHHKYSRYNTKLPPSNTTPWSNDQFWNRINFFVFKKIALTNDRYMKGDNLDIVIQIARNQEKSNYFKDVRVNNKLHKFWDETPTGDLVFDAAERVETWSFFRFPESWDFADC